MPGAVDVVGTANAAATVTVNNQATERKGEYFHKALALDNTAAPVYSQVDIVGVKNEAGPGGEDAVVLKRGNTYLPKTPEVFTHDADGNLTADGRWTYTWDAENRLMAMEAMATVPVAAKLELEFAYNYQSRRIQKLVYNWNDGSGAYQLQSSTKFVYDGWNLVAELDGNNNLIRSYIWGQDLSGTLQGTGGIGGLLLISDSGESYVPGYDGNGNVVLLISASLGLLAGSYDYGPFGEAIIQSGEHGERNPFKFSSKFTDFETDFVYYGLRFHNPFAGRWLSRDPLEEAGGSNLYAFVKNEPIHQVDPWGLKVEDVKVVVKSFILDFGSSGEQPPEQIMTSPRLVMPNMTVPMEQAWSYWTVLLSSIRMTGMSNPQSDSRDQGYRLYSERHFKVCFDQGKLIEVTPRPKDHVNTDVGPEGFLTPLPMVTWGVKASKRDDSVFEFGWSGKGKPHPWAETLFQSVYPRSSVYIWHTISGEIKVEGQSLKTTVELRGSAFPSHRVWVNNELRKHTPQGLLRDLWRPHPEDASRVK
ncbi:MAG: RHS repeat-associated core domain-containing protein [Acidobacteriota bacterium]